MSSRMRDGRPLMTTTRSASASDGVPSLYTRAARRVEQICSTLAVERGWPVPSTLATVDARRTVIVSELACALVVQLLTVLQPAPRVALSTY